MSASVAIATRVESRSPQAVRQAHILDAAETCFVRNGFHRTTMQDLAREAGMSPGNIYRYFDSKEAVVLGLAERERERGVILVEMLERAGDRRGVLNGILATYFTQMTRGAAILRLDLWAEATRNSAIGAMIERGDAEGRKWLIEIFSAIAPGCDAAGLYAAVSPLMKGIIVDLALSPDYEPGPAIRQLLALIDAGLKQKAAP